MTELEKIQQDKNAALKALYKKWPDFKRYLSSLGCKSTDAEDVFQEALLLFTRKIDEPDFELTVAPFHYVKSTCKFIWYNASRKNAKMRTDELSDTISDEDSDWMIKELKLKKIETAILKIGKQCQELLKLFYGNGTSMAEIAKKLGLRNDKVAKAQKYRCIHKVKEVIAQSETENEELNFNQQNS